ncbi:MAG: hypothetical protein ACYTAF_14565 [Planctomycetota bacterium]|jgi:hypothetical protein
MPIAYTCQKCGIQGNANDFFAGRKGRCSCGSILDFTRSVPDPSLPLGRKEGGKITDKRTGLDRRLGEGPFTGPNRRKGGDRRRS